MEGGWGVRQSGWGRLLGRLEAEEAAIEGWLG